MNEQELSDTELFDQAVADEGAEEISGQQTDQQVDQTQQQADTQAASQDQPTDADRQQIDDNAPHIPSWRLREVNEERRRFAEENERIKAELAELRRASQQPRQQTQTEQERPARPDPLIDPEGYAKHVREEIRQEVLSERREESLQAAAEQHPEDFKAAYALAQQRVDPALKARMQESRNPGRTLLEWYREQKTMQEVGNDPKAWLEKQLEERLKDPAFLARAVEVARGSAQQQRPAQNNGRPKVELPPSMTGASRANAALRSQDTNDDVSDRELFEQIAG
ncbi:hypothetical protein [Bradyrhizobium elkanii]|uniref:hypothetical protein n=1 Tax=Bradyrhizobium elkanii TaxID=29448 RepID=UPI0014496117|nr:hypothetical protein [Bradyrhizobium elkanii]MCP1932521.1 hypothetical protein [Bradyrhizobium elkanii]MCS3479552.1 hypothetical protein [Bradyrhizobium elkanii]MCS3576937.1 hypothetical protein [Bradyrhizobium elkanii]MCS3719814.1 hypothetical protein [Bradyrhizobium elkanii]MCS4004231.1 hypothetical protein [Bradyrhizobium elkanii USDA 61]